MSTQARVHSVHAIKDFKLSLMTFQEEARNALTTVDMQIRQVRNWLERDQLSYWKGQIKKRQEQVMQARADLHRRQLSQQNSDTVSDADQKEALREAQRRLREAEEKLAIIKKWIPILEHATAEYNAASQPLGDRLSGRLEESFAVLERMIGALESYLALKAPTAPEMPPTGGAAAASGGSKAATSTAASDGGGETEAAAPAAADAGKAAAAAPSANGAEGETEPAPARPTSAPVTA
jgi:AcrR family transcriptional regulator